MNIRDLVEILKEKGYIEHSKFLKNEIINFNEKTAIKLKTIKASENEFEIGESKIGGFPHLKHDFDWSTFNGKHLAFLGQINLKEISVYDKEKLLPSSGILYFFYEGGMEVWGYDPKDKAGFKVIYEKDIGNLELSSHPEGLEKYLIFSPCKLKFTDEKTYSTDAYSIYNKFEAAEIVDKEILDDEEVLNTMLEYYEDNLEIVTQLLGNPYLIQGDIFLESQLVSNGLYCGDQTGYNDPKAKELESGLKDWILLFQLDSEDDANMMWEI